MAIVKELADKEYVVEKVTEVVNNSIVVDTTLTQSGKAADAKAVGDALAEKQPAGNYLTSYTETDPTVPAWAKNETKPTYTASEVGADAEGTANSLISTHNIASDSHTDIREQISQLSTDKADKSAMTLGVHTDGLVYLFINGAPQGNGLDIKADVVDGDVFGYVDENNVIVLNGALAEGTYAIKYEMDDGSTVEIGNLVLDNNVYYSITNKLTNCTNSNSATQAVQGGSYSTTITAKSGYELFSVKVTMGGSDISSTAVSGGVINIASVTGDIVITAVAEEVEAGEPVNLAQTDSTNKTDISIWCNDARLGSDYGYRALAGNIVTNYFSFEVGDTVYIKGLTIDTTTSTMINSLSFYDSSKNGLSISNVEYYLGKNDYIDLSSDANYPYIFDTTKLGNSANVTGTKFMRISAKLSGSLSDVVINVKRNGVWVTTNGSDGSGDDSGDTGSSPSYTNLLPSAVDTDGTPYGDGKGYISGYKLSCSSAGGTPSATSGAYVSGFMPLSSNQDVIRIKNVALHANANVNNIIFYNQDKTKLRSVAGIEGGFAELVRVDDGNVYRAWPGSWLSNTTAENIGFFRFSCGGITDETIVTVNEEIV